MKVGIEFARFCIRQLSFFRFIRKLLHADLIFSSEP